MKEKLEELIIKGKIFIEQSSEEVLQYKKSIDQWSKKEILGHLVDSGIYNLQRFTEIQFHPKPFKIKSYSQIELVKANNYQQAKTEKLLELWMSLNYRIKEVMEIQKENSLSFKIMLENGEIKDLKFLMEDYVMHLEHHLNQIID